MFKKLLSIILALVIVVGMGTNVFATQDNHIDKLKEEFESQLLNQLSLAKGDELLELTYEYNKYINLSEEDKYKLIEYINDGEFMEEVMKDVMSASTDIILETSDNNRKKSKITKISPDVSNEQTIKDEIVNITTLNNSTMSGVETRTATYTDSVLLFGIRVMETKHSVTYTRTGYGGRIIEALSGDHWVSRNFTLNRTDFYNQRDFTSGPNLYAESHSDVTISLIYKGVWTYEDGRCAVWVDNYGTVGGSFGR